jgi:hypothetical protein
MIQATISDFLLFIVIVDDTKSIRYFKNFSRIAFGKKGRVPDSFSRILKFRNSSRCGISEKSSQGSKDLSESH